MRALALAFVWVCATFAASAGELDRMKGAPKTWKGHVFKPSYDFPKTAPRENQPWRTINFRREPRAYMDALLAYA